MMKQMFILVILVLNVYCQITYEECKRDCTMDWLDCTSGCDSIGNPQYCHQNCQKIVHSCLDECPKLMCIDECRIILEQCRKNGKGVCEIHFNQCQLICEETYDQNEDI